MAPSSIIAYALGSTEHAEFLFNAEPKKSWDHQFSDNAGADKFFVKVHFASEFHSFRKQIFASADHQEFIASLGSCDPWQVHLLHFFLPSTLWTVDDLPRKDSLESNLSCMRSTSRWL